MSELPALVSMPDLSSRIVGGSPVEEGRFDFQAALLSGGEQVCGGSLIAPNIVLSAAHCRSDSTHVALGCTDLADLENCEVIEVSSHTIFPGNSFDFSGDLQLLLLEEDSTQEVVSLVTPDLVLEDGTDLTVIGWGATNPNSESGSNVLLETNVELMNREDCNLQLADVKAIQSGITERPNITVVDDTMLCAASDGKDACYGDSGGPIFLRCDATGEDVQVGVVSFGIGCAYDGIPGVYASVATSEGFKFINDFVVNQGHSLKTLSNFEDFCRVNGTQPLQELSDPPTPFPTFDLNKWSCSSNFFATEDGCHCNCGLPDPDCEFDSVVLNCDSSTDTCIGGICITSPTTTSTQAPTSAAESLGSSVSVVIALILSLLQV